MQPKAIKFVLKNKIFISINVLLLSLLFILVICTKVFYNSVKLDSQILFADSTLKVTPSKLSQHNLDLISTLQMRETLGHNSILSSNDGLRQTRSIYIGVIGVLLTFIFSKLNDKNQIANNKVYIIILILIVLFYGIDVHLKDLKQMITDSNKITSSSLDFIVKQKPPDYIWYNIDYSKRNLQYPEIKNARIFRKLNEAFNPDITEIVFFILPFISIYILMSFKYLKSYTT